MPSSGSFNESAQYFTLTIFPSGILTKRSYVGMFSYVDSIDYCHDIPGFISVSMSLILLMFSVFVPVPPVHSLSPDLAPKFIHVFCFTHLITLRSYSHSPGYYPQLLSLTWSDPFLYIPPFVFHSPPDYLLSSPEADVSIPCTSVSSCSVYVPLLAPEGLSSLRFGPHVLRSSVLLRCCFHLPLDSFDSLASLLYLCYSRFLR